MRVCPTTKWHCFYTDDVMGCAQVHEMHHMFFWSKNNEIYNLECVAVLPECVPKCFLV